MSQTEEMLLCACGEMNSDFLSAILLTAGLSLNAPPHIAGIYFSV